jgi:uncharacterized protein
VCEYIETRRTHLRLNAELGSYDKKVVHAIIDEAAMCHVSAVVDGTPYIQATVHWREGESVYIHGAVKNKMIKAISQGSQACLAFSHFDGYLLPRSGFNHAVLYRSVVAFTEGRIVEHPDEKRRQLKIYIESIQPGRWQHIRPPSEDELKQTGIIEFPLTEVSAKSIPLEMAALLMPGGEMEVPDDAAYNPWTGVIPYETTAGAAIPATELAGHGS